MALAFFAATITPEVFLSNRCTIPGRITPLIWERSLQWKRSAFTRVPESIPAPGWTTIPAGLLTTTIHGSSKRISSGISSGITSNLRGGGIYPVIRSPSLSRTDGFDGTWLRTMRCSRMSFLIWDRVSSPTFTERYVSNRTPASELSTTNLKSSVWAIWTQLGGRYGVIIDPMWCSFRFRRRWGPLHHPRWSWHPKAPLPCWPLR